MATEIVKAEGGVAAEAKCPAGFRVTGGGFELTEYATGNETDLFVKRNHPTPDGAGWYVEVGIGGFEGEASVTAYAICSRDT